MPPLFQGLAVKSAYFASRLYKTANFTGRFADCRVYAPENALLCREHHNELTQSSLDSGFVIDALLGCTAMKTGMNVVPKAFTACLLRSHEGVLREPQRSMLHYDPKKSIVSRTERFDNIAWQLWDLKSSGRGYNLDVLTMTELRKQIEVLYSKRFILYDSIPLFLPSLGTLQGLGSRIRLRLEVNRLDGTHEFFANPHTIHTFRSASTEYRPCRQNSFSLQIPLQYIQKLSEFATQNGNKHFHKH